MTNPYNQKKSTKKLAFNSNITNILSYLLIYWWQMNFSTLLNTQKTVFTIQQIGQILWIKDNNTLRVQLTRRKKNGLMQNLHYGIRSLPHYSRDEVANILKSPSYISLETVLYQAWITFQYYGNTIFSVSNNTKSFIIQEINYTYNKIATSILLNPKGITYNKWVAFASIERAICDRLYLTPWHHFDNLRNISRNKLLEIAEIYNNKRLILDITQLKNGIRY